MSEKNQNLDWIEKTNEAFMDAMEQNTKMQQEFIDSWTKNMEESQIDPEQMQELYQSYGDAFQKWTEATEEASEKISQQVSEGEEVDIEEYRDIWLDAANEALKEIISTTAFAAAIGDILEDTSQTTQQIEKTVQDTLRTAGLATSKDIQEVGERLVELERRQHELQRKLEEVIENLE